jgi:hypothetical protein
MEWAERKGRRGQKERGQTGVHRIHRIHRIIGHTQNTAKPNAMGAGKTDDTMHGIPNNPAHRKQTPHAQICHLPIRRHPLLPAHNDTADDVADHTEPPQT